MNSSQNDESPEKEGSLLKQTLSYYAPQTQMGYLIQKIYLFEGTKCFVEDVYLFTPQKHLFFTRRFGFTSILLFSNVGVLFPLEHFTKIMACFKNTQNHFENTQNQFASFRNQYASAECSFKRNVL